MEYYTNSKITELPHLLGTQYTKSISDGQIKEQYQLRYLVLNDEANSFIKSLPISYEEHALANTSRDERGGFTIVTAQYGEAGMTDDALQNEDGEIHWWTLSNGKYTYHVKKLVRNTPEAIKAFCERCKTSYGYTADETSVSMSPSYGEKYVYAEATFTENESQGGSSGGGDFNDDEADEKGNIEAVESVSMSNSQDVIPIPLDQYLFGEFGVIWKDLYDLVKDEDSGKRIYREAGELGVVKYTGWYDATDDNLKNLEEGKGVIQATETVSKANVDKCRLMLQNIPSATITNITVTFNNSISSRSPLSLNTIKAKLSDAGTLSDSISMSGFSMSTPESLKKTRDTNGKEHPLEVKWQNLGSSFDVSSVKKKYGKNQMPYYTGQYTTQYKTVISFTADTSHT